MKISENLSNVSVLSELGGRLARHRLRKNLTQADLAAEAGVSKRTLERIEAGNSAQLSSLINILRALDLLDNVDLLIPEPVPSPLQQLKLRGKERKRASPDSSSDDNDDPWAWDDEA